MLEMGLPPWQIFVVSFSHRSKWSVPKCSTLSGLVVREKASRVPPFCTPQIRELWVGRTGRDVPPFCTPQIRELWVGRTGLRAVGPKIDMPKRVGLVEASRRRDEMTKGTLPNTTHAPSRALREVKGVNTTVFTFWRPGGNPVTYARGRSVPVSGVRMEADW